MTRGANRRRGMSTLQAVLLLGAGFLVVWGLMDVWKEVQDPLQTKVDETLRGKMGKITPGSGQGASAEIDGGPAATREPEIKRISHEPKKPPTTTEEPNDTTTGANPGESEGKTSLSGFLDGFQTTLDIIGMAPVIGEPVDLFNAGVSAIRGDWVGAGLGLGSALPIAGWGATLAKWARKLPLDELVKHADEAAAALKQAEAAGDAKKAAELREQLAALQKEQARRGVKNPVANSGRKYLDPEDFAKLPRTGTIDPKQVRFSQDSIASNFKDGGGIDDLVKGINSGKVDPSSIPAIRIVEKDGKIFTLDNRRLWVFQKAGVPIKYEKLDKIPAREGFKFTTNNGGTDILVRNATE